MTEPADVQTPPRRNVVQLSPRAFEQRLERERDKGTRDALAQLPQILKEQLGFDPAAVKELLAKQTTPKVEVQTENPKAAAESAAAYEERIKKLMADERAEFLKTLDSRDAEHKKQIGELTTWREQREAEANEVARQAEYEEAWADWRKYASEKVLVAPKYQEMLEADAARWLNQLGSTKPDHVIFDDNATEAQLAEAWEKEFYAPRRTKFPEMFVVKTPEPQPGQPRQPNRPPVQPAAPGSKSVMDMTPEEYQAEKRRQGFA